MVLMIFALLSMTLAHATASTTLDFQAEDAKGFADESVHWRSNARGLRAVWLHNIGDRLTITICLPKAMQVAVEEVRFSSDGLEKRGAILVDENEVDTFLTAGNSDFGNSWNRFQTAGPFNTVALAKGKHTFNVLMKSSMDPWGLEIDQIVVRFEVDVRREDLFCSEEKTSTSPAGAPSDSSVLSTTASSQGPQSNTTFSSSSVTFLDCTGGRCGNVSMSTTRETTSSVPVTQSSSSTSVFMSTAQSTLSSTTFLTSSLESSSEGDQQTILSPRTPTTEMPNLDELDRLQSNTSKLSTTRITLGGFSEGTYGFDSSTDRTSSTSEMIDVTAVTNLDGSLTQREDKVTSNLEKTTIQHTEGRLEDDGTSVYTTVVLADRKTHLYEDGTTVTSIFDSTEVRQSSSGAAATSDGETSPKERTTPISSSRSPGLGKDVEKSSVRNITLAPVTNQSDEEARLEGYVTMKSNVTVTAESLRSGPSQQTGETTQVSTITKTMVTAETSSDIGNTPSHKETVTTHFYSSTSSVDGWNTYEVTSSDLGGDGKATGRRELTLTDLITRNQVVTTYRDLGSETSTYKGATSSDHETTTFEIPTPAVGELTMSPSELKVSGVSEITLSESTAASGGTTPSKVQTLRSDTKRWYGETTTEVYQKTASEDNVTFVSDRNPEETATPPVSGEELAYNLNETLVNHGKTDGVEGTTQNDWLTSVGDEATSRETNTPGQKSDRERLTDVSGKTTLVEVMSATGWTTAADTTVPFEGQSPASQIISSEEETTTDVGEIKLSATEMQLKGETTQSVWKTTDVFGSSGKTSDITDEDPIYKGTTNLEGFTLSSELKTVGVDETTPVDTSNRAVHMLSADETTVSVKVTPTVHEMNTLEGRTSGLGVGKTTAFRETSSVSDTTQSVVKITGAEGVTTFVTRSLDVYYTTPLHWMISSASEVTPSEEEESGSSALNISSVSEVTPFEGDESGSGALNISSVDKFTPSQGEESGSGALNISSVSNVTPSEGEESGSGALNISSVSEVTPSEGEESGSGALNVSSVDKFTPSQGGESGSSALNISSVSEVTPSQGEESGSGALNISSVSEVTPSEGEESGSGALNISSVSEVTPSEGEESGSGALNVSSVDKFTPSQAGESGSGALNISNIDEMTTPQEETTMTYLKPVTPEKKILTIASSGEMSPGETQTVLSGKKTSFPGKTTLSVEKHSGSSETTSVTKSTHGLEQTTLNAETMFDISTSSFHKVTSVVYESSSTPEQTKANDSEKPPVLEMNTTVSADVSSTPTHSSVVTCRWQKCARNFTYPTSPPTHPETGLTNSTSISSTSGTSPSISTETSGSFSQNSTLEQTTLVSNHIAFTSRQTTPSVSQTTPASHKTTSNQIMLALNQTISTLDLGSKEPGLEDRSTSAYPDVTTPRTVTASEKFSFLCSRPEATTIIKRTSFSCYKGRYLFNVHVSQVTDLYLSVHNPVVLPRSKRRAALHRSTLAFAGNSKHPIVREDCWTMAGSLKALPAYIRSVSSLRQLSFHLPAWINPFSARFLQLRFNLKSFDATLKKRNAVSFVLTLRTSCGLDSSAVDMQVRDMDTGDVVVRKIGTILYEDPKLSSSLELFIPASVLTMEIQLNFSAASHSFILEALVFEVEYDEFAVGQVPISDSAAAYSGWVGKKDKRYFLTRTSGVRLEAINRPGVKAMTVKARRKAKSSMEIRASRLIFSGVSVENYVPRVVFDQTSRSFFFPQRDPSSQTSFILGPCDPYAADDVDSDLDEVEVDDQGDGNFMMNLTSSKYGRRSLVIGVTSTMTTVLISKMEDRFRDRLTSYSVCSFLLPCSQYGLNTQTIIRVDDAKEVNAAGPWQEVTGKSIKVSRVFPV